MSQELENNFLSALEKNHSKLFRICSVYTKEKEDAKDLFQEVLVQIWESIGAFENRSSIETWMFRIALNVCLRFRSNSIKERKQFISVDYELARDMVEDQRATEHLQQLTKLKSCIRLLNEAERAVIALHLEELPYKEISNITGLTENTIAVKIKRIKKKLLKCVCLNEKSW